MKYALERSENCKLQEGNRKLKEDLNNSVHEYNDLINHRLARIRVCNLARLLPKTRAHVQVAVGAS